MVIKRVLVPERLRHVPAQFSWIDQRLVRDRHIEHCDAHACALYLFLLTVADASLLQHGMSLKEGPYFQRDLSLSVRVWIDHQGHGDRYERSKAIYGGAVTRLY